jgi:hypothetical protein
VKIHPLKAPKIKEIMWHPPLIYWTKCNLDDARVSLDNAACDIVV